MEHISSILVRVLSQICRGPCANCTQPTPQIYAREHEGMCPPCWKEYEQDMNAWLLGQDRMSEQEYMDEMERRQAWRQ